MKTIEPPVIHLSDYTAISYKLENVHLQFDLTPDATIVRSDISLKRSGGGDDPLILDGEDLELLLIEVDGVALSKDKYSQDDSHLTINDLPQKCVLTIETRVNPVANTKLEGLYKSGTMYCTQCEAEGFRRITYFPDRPDVMTIYKVTIRADKKTNPILLSNGNNVENGDLSDGRHYAVWDDPFPKPSYLFAVVAGDLAEVSDSFTTMNGRKVDLKIFVEHGNEGRCDYAMDALKRSMRWDEVRFNLEYDLDIFNIVAVSDFNMGAMENKSLNVFNAKYVLADPGTATDMDFSHIEAIVAHEYFHNWTGNRVTCRDWFQLSLKEGLTVFRDQEFSADQRSAAVKRIQDVRLLRARQYPEDAGPLAHPVRPESYMEINNFYTATIYEKGAEVIRMMHTILGEAGFQKGCALYFKRHDGQAVTCDDFISAMADATNVDLSQFKLWYSQAGTPEITIDGQYDKANKSYQLRLNQNTKPTPGQTSKSPLHIPFKVALLGDDGQDLSASLEGVVATEHLLELKSTSQTFTFEGVLVEPSLSVNRDFTAPVTLSMTQTDKAQAFLFAHDTNSFSRWDAGQQYSCNLLLTMVNDIQAGRDVSIDTAFLDAIGNAISDDNLDAAFKALLLTLPSEEYIAEQMAVIDVDAIHQAREMLRGAIAKAHFGAFKDIYGAMTQNAPFAPDAVQAGKRSLRNLALAYMAAGDKDNAGDLLLSHFNNANNMTDSAAALGELCQLGGDARDVALSQFQDRWLDNEQIMDKWLMMQAMAKNKDTLARVKTLMDHPVFSMTNPNKVRALIGVFSMANPVCFHKADGEGYDFLADQVIALNALNPQVAARLLGPLGQWRRFDEARRNLMKVSLQRILDSKDLSRDVYEIASKSLNG